MERKLWITWWIIFCIRYSKPFWIYLEKHGEKTNNPSIRIYVKKKKIVKRIVFRIKIGYYLELLMPETMNLPGSTKNKITKNENYWSNLEI